MWVIDKEIATRARSYKTMIIPVKKIIHIVCFFVSILIILPEILWAQNRYGEYDVFIRAYINFSWDGKDIVVILDKTEKIESTGVKIVRPGRHTIAAFKKDRSLWLKPSYYKVINVEPNDTVDVVISLQHNVWINSEPTGASVFINDRFAGITPLSVILTKSDKLFLQKEGFKRKTLLFKDLCTGIVTVELCPESKIYVSVNSRKSWIYSTAFLSFAGNVAGFFLKKSAEKAFRNYVNSDNPEKMNFYFSRTKKFDDMSAVCYMAGEISLGISVYLLIKDFQSR